ncbi:MAG: phytochelatin synthase family protein [Gloeobacterales cyanobacterium]
MRYILKAIAASCLVILATQGHALAQTLPIPSNLITLNSSEGEQLLLESKTREDYWSLSLQFVSQKNGAYCGVASSVMVLNALAVLAPSAPELGPYKTFTQENFFNEQNQKFLPAEVVSRQGMTLDQLGKLLDTYPVQTEIYHGENSSLEEFRKIATNILKEPNNFVLVNYLRKTIGQATGGHISPLAAYSEKTDRFLILDVSRYKYPPVWVKTAELWNSMNTLDTGSGKTRGFVVVSALHPN